MAKPIIAIMYDFDKTLCSKDMQNYGFIPNLGMTPEEFWGQTGEICKKINLDKILGYMYMMVKKCKEKKIPLTREYLKNLGAKVEFFKGVDTWFQRINAYGDELGIKVEHYIISSGTKEIIEGTSIAGEFKKIYGCEFMYGDDKIAMWPKKAINYTNKTQYLFRVSKGALDENDDDGVNQAADDDKRRVQYTNMIYIGDGMTDIPCMKLVKERGGKAIAIYQYAQKEKVFDLVNDGRINYACLCDYSEGSRLDKIVKLILDGMSISHKINETEDKYFDEYMSKMQEKQNDEK